MSTHAARSPKADEEAKAVFRTLVPEDERVTIRPMFGAVAAFANGLMFMGLFATVTEAGGGSPEPMPGKPMRGYVTIPNWRSDQSAVLEWGRQALDYTLTLPPKK